MRISDWSSDVCSSDLEVTGMSGGGMVEVVLTGKGEARKVAIDRALVDPAEVEVLEDLLVAAINDARAKADARSAEDMQKLTGGLRPPPGFKLPFCRRPPQRGRTGRPAASPPGRCRTQRSCR